MVQARSYADRFGYTWSVRSVKPRRSGAEEQIVFTSGDIRLVAPANEEIATVTPAELKEIFCDAERIVTSEGETWYVGYRERASGRGARQRMLCTRFRSEGGEIRYSSDIIDFRHLPTDILRQHLATAQAVKEAAGRR